MLPKYHFLIGLVFSLSLFFIFPQITFIKALIILVSAVVMDFDHYVYYVSKKRSLNLKKAYHWFSRRHKKVLSLSREKRNEIYLGIHFLHGLEPLLILFVLGIYISEYFFYILIGFTLHLFLDVIHQRTIHDRFDRISLIYDILKFKKKKLKLFITE